MKQPQSIGSDVGFQDKIVCNTMKIVTLFVFSSLFHSVALCTGLGEDLLTIVSRHSGGDVGM